MKRKALARLVALALTLCLLLSIPAVATSWGTPGQTASEVSAPALYAGDAAILTGAAGGIGAYVDGQGGLYLTGYEGSMTQQYAAQIVHVDEAEVFNFIQKLFGRSIKQEMSLIEEENHLGFRQITAFSSII